MHGPTTIGTEPSDAVDLSKSPWAVFYFLGAGTLSGGVIILEEAPEKDTPGTWAPITGMTLNANTLTAGGAVGALHLPVGAYAWVRARASTPLAGGGDVSVIVESTQLW